MADDTTTIDDLLAPGGTITIPQGDYNVDYVRPRSNSTITIESGTTFSRNNGTADALLDLEDISNTTIYCNDAIFNGETGDQSPTTHTIRIQGAQDCEIHDIDVNSSYEDTKDGIYITSSATNNTERCKIVGGRVRDAKRNGISIISGTDCTIDGVEVYGTVGAPGAGIDIEQNDHDDDASNNTIINCTVRNNENSGILHQFGDGTTIRFNKCYSNGDHGILVTSGANTRTSSVWRSGTDVLGISAFDGDENTITVGSLDVLPVGGPVTFSLFNSASLPTGLPPQVYTVIEHIDSDKIRVGGAVGVAGRDFDGDESGTLNSDPDLSDFVLNVYGQDNHGQNIVISENTCYSNGGRGIDVRLMHDPIVTKNTCRDNGTQQIRLLGCYRPTVTNNRVFSGTDDGITVSRGHGGVYSDNIVSNVSGYGLNLVGISKSKVTGNVVNGAASGEVNITTSSEVASKVKKKIGKSGSGFVVRMIFRDGAERDF